MGLSIALRSLALLDVQSSTPAVRSVATPCIQAHLHLLATETCEKCVLSFVRDRISQPPAPPSRCAPLQWVSKDSIKAIRCWGATVVESLTTTARRPRLSTLSSGCEEAVTPATASRASAAVW